jgi:O-acetylhomoserine (thiol)-lyase
MIESMRRGGVMRRRCYPTEGSLPFRRFRNTLASVHAESKYNGFAKTPFDGKACSLMAFGIEKCFTPEVRFYDALKLVTRLVNVGEAQDKPYHPASTPHRQMSGAEQRAAGVSREIIRLSICVVQVDDMIADSDHSLDAAN